jgi:hypothetical protein
MASQNVPYSPGAGLEQVPKPITTTDAAILYPPDPTGNGATITSTRLAANPSQASTKGQLQPGGKL